MDYTPLINTLDVQEGFRATVYDDANGRPIVKGSYVDGNPTIGIGTLIGPGGGITQAEARYLLTNRIAIAAEAAQKYLWFAQLNEARQFAIIDMIFNMGAGTFDTFKQFQQLMQTNSFASAANDLAMTTYARQVPSRAAAIEKAIRTGIWS
jgi:lysozyme